MFINRTVAGAPRISTSAIGFLSPFDLGAMVETTVQLEFSLPASSPPGVQDDVLMGALLTLQSRSVLDLSRILSGDQD